MFQLPRWENLKLLSAGRNKTFWLIVLVILISSIFGFVSGTISFIFFSPKFSPKIENYLSGLKLPFIEKQAQVQGISGADQCISGVDEEKAIVEIVKKSSPAVISIIITKDLPVLEEYFYSPFKEFEEFFGPNFFQFKIPQYRQKGTEKKEIGGGTGFFISEDGMILTNAHVISDKEAEYTVLTNDGKKYPAKILARDNLRDLAVIKIEKGGRFPVLKLGDSDKLQIGQRVIAIGNALGEFKNTVSVGVVSGLGRTITASGGGIMQTMEDVIQTDAAINQGNSGGPLLNLRGEVIGINFAMAQLAENIGFAIPINKAKKAIGQIKTLGKISQPFLGVRYIIINETVQERNNLPVNYGAWIIRDIKESGIYPGSAAEKAGLKEGDIILEINGEKITFENSLEKIIMRYNPGDKIVLKILRNGQEKNIEVVLGERNE